MTLKFENLKAPLFPDPSGAVDANDWCIIQKCLIRGLGFKFVDFLYKSPDVCYKEIKLISSENAFFYLSYEILSIFLLNMVSAQQLIKHTDRPSPGARRENFDVETMSNFK